RVALRFQAVADTPMRFAIPAWTPGYYQILHFEQGIENVRAEDEAGQPVPVTHPEARTWEVAPRRAGSLLLTYDVRASDTGLGFFGSVLDGRERQGYINGASAFLYPVGQTDRPVSLTLALPAGWKIASALSPQTLTARAQQPVTFQARDYDELIDSPLQIGQFDSAEFAVSGVKFRCLFVGSSGVMKSRLVKALGRIVKAAFDVFSPPGGKPPPFSHYLFVFHSGGPGFYGGLEHRNSTVIHMGDKLGDGSADGLLTLAAHEFFHAWNVKRLRPVGLGPFDYTQPVRSGSLWFAEGITDYYAQLLPLRAGLRDRAWFLKVMAGRIAELAATPARARGSLEEASRKTWEGQSEGYDGLNYYLKGSLVGFYFDLRLRALTGGAKGLDDVMRELDRQYGQRNLGYPEEALRNILNAVAGSDLTEEYARYVRGTEEIAWTEALAQAGLTLQDDPAAMGDAADPETPPRLVALPDSLLSDETRRVREAFFQTTRAAQAHLNLRADSSVPAAFLLPSDLWLPARLAASGAGP
ncbi:MAG TPA: hypothetical protein VFB21_11845, partial [Chthonomonadaceae bacterium]|nr:hypothetical protein [Chthonomonadaceae bacterium]